MKSLVRAELVNDPFGDPGLYLDFRFARRALLFDLGDLGAMVPRKLLRVTDGFVSHAHIDHLIGFDRLLRVLLVRERRLRLFGPPGFIDRIESKLQGYSWNLVERFPAALEILAAEFHPGERIERATFACRDRFRRVPAPPGPSPGGVLLEEIGFSVRGALLEHDIPCLAFAFVEGLHVNVLKDGLAALGLGVGPWLAEAKQAVLSGEPRDRVIVARWREAGRMREARMTLGELRDKALAVTPGEKIAYVTDVVYSDRNRRQIVALARDADMLFIEAVFLDADAALAAERCHLTAAQAGRIAREAGVKRLIVFHFSPRYAGREHELRAEADEAFRR